MESVSSLPAFSSSRLHDPHEFEHTSVLIIDDDAVYRTLLRDVCKKLGIGTIAEAVDGEQGLQLHATLNPDLVLLDIMMPGIDGLEVCRRLRARAGTTDTAILIQTGVTDEARRMEGFQAGANDIVSKPLNITEFMARVRTHLRNAVYRHNLATFHHRIEAHLDIANNLLAALQPDTQAAKDLAHRNGFELTVTSKRHEEISGDLWYLHEIYPGRLLCIILDTNSAGLAGAINALRIDTALRQIWRQHDDNPQNLLKALDTIMAESPCGKLFASVTAVILDSNKEELWYTGSGNPYPILCHDNQIEALMSGGLPLGSGCAPLEMSQHSLKTGDTLILHTDGWPVGTTNPLDEIQTAFQQGTISAAKLINDQSPTTDDITIITLQRSR
jgi:sigma-B regulation protein RsbU (phosphoserine phosphatase)